MSVKFVTLTFLLVSSKRINYQQNVSFPGAGVGGPQQSDKF